ncbi:MAG: TrmB family transcriptional regulator [Halobacteriota archaeon]
MTDEDDFIAHLMGFGLTEKEAQCYFHLLRYGPKTPSPLAKALHTYREDMHRTLNSLIDKGMVRPSLDSPTLYAAVELDTALESALKKHESELHEMERRKRELEELSRRHSVRSSDNASTFKIIKTIRELVTTMLPIVRTLADRWDMFIPESAVIIASQFGINEGTKMFTDRGGKVRILVADFPYALIETIQELIEMEIEVRYLGKAGLFFTIFDRRVCMSAINVDMKHIALDQPLAVLLTDDPTYAQYLTSTFEMLWVQSIDAEERIHELLQQGPPQAGQE